jgi:hypothetical protein
MSNKRHQRLTRLAEEIEKLRGGDGGNTSSESGAQPRRVSNDAFFWRIATMRNKGGAREVPKAKTS